MEPVIEFVISADTTGSMSSCIAEVRRKIDQTAARLFKEIPNLRIGIIAHGDYCDAGSTYVTKHLQLTDNPQLVSNFIKTVSNTGGGDWEECYEKSLHEAGTMMHWTPGSKRVFAMFGDAIPHPPAHNPGRLDWRKEVDTLTNMGILIHSVQCLNNSRATPFWKEMADRSGGFHINLNQFNESTDLLVAMAYQQQGQEYLDKYEQEVESGKRMTRSMSSMFDKLSKRDSKGRFRKVPAEPVRDGRFQRIHVDTDMAIKAMVESHGMPFKQGRGFYEFTKKETIQSYKEIVILDKESGDMYTGDAAREILGLSDMKADIKPDYDRTKYSVFVQSTSTNRKLIGGTTFLYEADLDA